MAASQNGGSQPGVKLVDRSHNLIDFGRCIESRNRKIRLRTRSVHPGMLEHRVLLKSVRSTAIIKSYKITDRQAAIKDLAANKYIQFVTKLELPIAVQ